MKIQNLKVIPDTIAQSETLPEYQHLHQWRFIATHDAVWESDFLLRGALIASMRDCPNQELYARLFAAAPQLLAIAQFCEWCDVRPDGLSYCPHCERSQVDGHSAGCLIRLTLNAIKPL